MPEHTFKTKIEAFEAGYALANHQVLESYRGYTIKQADTSGCNNFGYSYGVKAIPSDDLIMQGHRTLGPFGKTVSIWLKEGKNKLWRQGSFVPAWEPGALDAAFEEARKAIDEAMA